MAEAKRTGMCSQRSRQAPLPGTTVYQSDNKPAFIDTAIA